MKRGERRPIGARFHCTRPGPRMPSPPCLPWARWRCASPRLPGWGFLLLLIVFVVPIMISGYVGGAGPGLLSTAIAAAGTAHFVMVPGDAFSIVRPLDFFQWGVLIGLGVLISVLYGRLRHARRVAEQGLAGARLRGGDPA